MFDFLSGLMGGAGGVSPELLQLGQIPSAMQQFQAGPGQNAMPQMQGVDPMGAAMGAGPGAGQMPGVMDMPGAVTTPFPMVPGAQGPGMRPAEQMAMGWNGPMPDPAAMPGGGPAGFDPAMLAALGGIGGGQEEPQPRYAPGGGIHFGKYNPYEWGPGAQFLGRGGSR